VNAIPKTETALKKIRKRSGYRQIDFAMKTGMPVRTIQNYEAGARVPNAFNAQRLADALGVEVRDIYPPPKEAI